MQAAYHGASIADNVWKLLEPDLLGRDGGPGRPGIIGNFQCYFGHFPDRRSMAGFTA